MSVSAFGVQHAAAALRPAAAKIPGSLKRVRTAAQVANNRAAVHYMMNPRPYRAVHALLDDPVGLNPFINKAAR